MLDIFKFLTLHNSEEIESTNIVCFMAFATKHIHQYSLKMSIKSSKDLFSHPLDLVLKFKPLVQLMIFAKSTSYSLMEKHTSLLIS